MDHSCRGFTAGYIRSAIRSDSHFCAGATNLQLRNSIANAVRWAWLQHPRDTPRRGGRDALAPQCAGDVVRGDGVHLLILWVYTLAPIALASAGARPARSSRSPGHPEGCSESRTVTTVRRRATPTAGAMLIRLVSPAGEAAAPALQVTAQRHSEDHNQRTICSRVDSNRLELPARHCRPSRFQLHAVKFANHHFVIVPNATTNRAASMPRCVDVPATVVSYIFTAPARSPRRIRRRKGWAGAALDRRRRIPPEAEAPRAESTLLFTESFAGVFDQYVCRRPR